MNRRRLNINLWKTKNTEWLIRCDYRLLVRIKAEQ